MYEKNHDLGAVPKCTQSTVENKGAEMEERTQRERCLSLQRTGGRTAGHSAEATSGCHEH